MESEALEQVIDDVEGYLHGLPPEEREEAIGSIQRILRKELFAMGESPTDLLCPHCGCTDAVKNGHTLKGTQRYRCRGCGKTFAHLPPSRILVNTKLSLEKWMAFAECFVDALSCDRTAGKVGVTHKTAWFMRIRTLEALRWNLPSFEVKAECGAYVDEMFLAESFKGVSFKNLGDFPREPRDNGIASKRGISDEQVCVLTGVNDNGDMFYDMVCRGPMTTEVARDSLEGLVLEGSIVNTDNLHAYRRVMDDLKVACHVANDSRDHESLEPVNSLHSAIKGFVNHRFRGVSTKWLPLYLAWYKWLREFGKSGNKLESIASRQICAGDYEHTWRSINRMPLPFRDGDLRKVKVGKRFWCRRSRITHSPALDDPADIRRGTPRERSHPTPPGPISGPSDLGIGPVPLRKVLQRRRHPRPQRLAFPNPGPSAPTQR